MLDLWQGSEGDESDIPMVGMGNILTVAVVTIANGCDNITIYTPIFATKGYVEITIITIVFVLMVAVWLAFSHWLVNHRP